MGRQTIDGTDPRREAFIAILQARSAAKLTADEARKLTLALYPEWDEEGAA